MPNPKGSENVSSCVPESLAVRIADLAKESGLSRSSYVRLLLEDAAKRNKTFKVKTTIEVVEG